MSISELATMRVNKATDNTQVKPVDLLRALLADIEAGRENPERLILIYVEGETHHTWRCGCTLEQELATIVYAEHRCLNPGP